MPAISTQGWDLVYALRLPEINRGIAAAYRKNASLIPKLEWQADDDSWSISGEFAVWQLTSAVTHNTGDTLVGMRFPITRATLHGDGEIYEIHNVAAIGLVSLSKLVEDSLNKFTIDHAKGVSQLKIDGDVPKGAEPLIDILAEFLDNNLQAFRHAFATVRLVNPGVASDNWFVPRKVAFSYSGGDTDETSYLALLCLTDPYVEGNPIPPLVLESGLIDSKSQCALVVSRSLFVQKLLLPAVARAFYPKLKQPDAFQAVMKAMFETADHDKKIVKRKGSGPFKISTKKFDVSFLYSVIGTIWLFPFAAPPAVLFALIEFVTNMIAHGNPTINAPMDAYLEDLTVTLEGDEFIFETSLRCELAFETVAGNISMLTIRLQVTNHFKLVRDPKGGFGFQQSRPPFHTSPKVDVPDWLQKANGISKVVAAIAGFVVSVVTEGVALGVLLAAIAGMELGKDIAGIVIEKAATGDAEKIAPVDLSKFVAAGMHPIRWEAGTQFEPTDVIFDGDLLLRGKLASA